MNTSLKLNTTEIDNILNDFLSPFDCTAKIDTDFYYAYTTNEIAYSLCVSSIANSTFQAFCKELRPEIQNCDIFLLSFFHELFHHETLDDFDDEEYNACMKEKENILKQLKATDNQNTIRELYYKYYSLPIEIIATTMALDYIINHTIEIKQLWNKLQPAILNFYNKYKIER